MEYNFNNLSVVGVNFHKTALDIRGKFAFTTEQIKKIYKDHKPNVSFPFFILSSCNRTEIYGLGATPEELLMIFTLKEQIKKEDVTKHAFIKTGEEVMKHIFRVASGLDSQILGDYEITGQLKNAFALAKKYDCAGGYIEKMVNTALQISKKIKNETILSDGTTSVSYSVIQMLKQWEKPGVSWNICILGLGEIGMFTLKNLCDYLPGHNITVITRNQAKAQAVALEFGVAFDSVANQLELIQKSDVVIVATAAEYPIIYSKDIEGGSVKLIFDLSVPNNVHPETGKLKNVKLLICQRYQTHVAI